VISSSPTITTDKAGPNRQSERVRRPAPATSLLDPPEPHEPSGEGEIAAESVGRLIERRVL
jgi:hypothetical protein